MRRTRLSLAALTVASSAVLGLPTAAVAAPDPAAGVDSAATSAGTAGPTDPTEGDPGTGSDEAEDTAGEAVSDEPGSDEPGSDEPVSDEAGAAAADEAAPAGDAGETPTEAAAEPDTAGEAPADEAPAEEVTAEAATAGGQVQLIAMNDFHGRISPQTGGDGQLVTSPGPDGDYATAADNVTSEVGGAANIATTLAELRAAFGDDAASFFVGAGDLVSASPFNSSVFKDEPTIEVLNALGLDYSAVGNHEFDRGQEELYRISGATDGQFSDDVTACQGVTPEVDGCFDDSTGQPFAGAGFPYLAANVTDAAGEPILPPYEVVTDGAGNEVGLIGVVTDDTPNIVSPEGVEGLTFGDEAEAVNEYAAELQALGVEAIAVMVHEGGTQPAGGGFDRCVGDMAGTPIGDINAAIDASVDVVISAHTHVPYDCELPDPAGNTRLVTQAGFYGKALTDIRLTIDPATGDVVRESSTATNVPVLRTAPDADVAAIVSYWEERAAAEGAESVGSQTADLDRAYRAGAPARDSESSLGNLVADAQLAAVPGADLAFMNPGGLRADINCLSSGPADPNGNVTFAETFGVQPFSNTVNTVELTGQGVHDVLEQQWGLRGGAASFLQLSVAGLTYEFDPLLPEGDRIDPASILVGEQPLDLAASYQVVANSFLIAGGDSFAAFVDGRPTPDTVAVTGPNDVDAFNAYLAATSPVTPPALDRAVSLDPAQPFDDDGSGAGPCDLTAPPATAPPTAPPPTTAPPAVQPVSGGTTGTGGTGSAGTGSTGAGTGGTGSTGSGAVRASGATTGSLAYTGVAVPQGLGLAGVLVVAGGLLTAAGYRRPRGIAD